MYICIIYVYMYNTYQHVLTGAYKVPLKEDKGVSIRHPLIFQVLN